jgi:flagellar hook-associated protein 2
MELESINSGIDSKALIDSIMAAERIPLQRMELNQTILNKKNELYSDVLGRLNNLKSRAADLSDTSAFDVFSITYSESSIVQMSTGTGASPAAYDITVNNIARAHTIGSDQQSDTDIALGLTAGTIQISGFGVSIDSDDSLQSIMDKINDTEDITVSATIVDNVLRIKNNDTGSEEIAIIDDNDICLDLGIIDGAGDFKNEFIQAADASFSIDGQEITSSTNTVTDIIEDITITLIGSGTTRAAISRDTSAIMGSITNLVSQYNSAVDYIYSKITEDRIIPPETDADKLAGLARGDSTLNSIRYRLATMVSGMVDGLDSDLDQFADIGISRASFSSEDSNNEDAIIGKLQIDTEVLQESIESDFEKVKDIFTKNYGVEDLEEDEYGMAVRIKNYMDLATDSDEGLISIKQDSFQSEVDYIDERIESMERFLELKEQTITRKFIRMEQALSTMDTQNMWLQAQISLM